jgi:TolB-like protein/Flp pilus assembly protein TadD
MTTARGQTKVMDFGLAKILREGPIDESQAETVLTEAGTFVGTVPYMSPEQLHGEDLDGRTDIFSFGAVLYEMISGRQPFTGRGTAAIISAILTKEPISLPDQIPAALDEIVRKCLAKNREQRYQTMGQLAKDLKILRSECETSAASGSQAITVKQTAATMDSVITGHRFLANKRKPLTSALIILVIAAFAYAMLFRSAPGVRHPQIQSLAVLPLQNLSGDAQQEYFADGMTEALISNLAQISALNRVISRTSVMRYKGSPKSLPEIAQELNVDAVIEASVRRSEGRVRITAKLVPAATDSPVWTREYERDLTDVLKLESEVARAIADEIRIQVTTAERARLASARSVDPQAHDAYLRGRSHLKRNEDDLKQAIQYLERAIQLAPDYAAAQAGLSDAWVQRGIWGERNFREIEAPARAAALAAVELDPQLAEAHASLSRIRFLFEWDWPGAEQELRRALELDPGSLYTHSYYADLLMSLGRHSEAIDEIERAEQLDPLSSETQSSFGRILYRARRYEEAIPHFKMALDLEPRNYSAHIRLADVYVKLGKYGEAITEFEKAGELRPLGMHQARIARVYALMGRRREARQMVASVKAAAFDSAAVYVALGDKDEAFRILEKAVEERNSLLVYLKEDPTFDDLHSDPRWQLLLRRMGFPP